MKTSWLIGFFFLMIGASLISGIIELQYLGGAAGTVGVFEKIFSPGVVSTSTVMGINFGFLTTTMTFLTGLWEAFWFDYAMFIGAYVIVRYLFIAVNLGIIVSLVLALRGTASS